MSFDSQIALAGYFIYMYIFFQLLSQQDIVEQECHIRLVLCMPSKSSMGITAKR